MLARQMVETLEMRSVGQRVVKLVGWLAGQRDMKKVVLLVYEKVERTAETKGH